MLFGSSISGCGQDNTAPGSGVGFAPPPGAGQQGPDVPQIHLEDPVDVLRIVDGDTFEVSLGIGEDGRPIRGRVRLKGINTPELANRTHSTVAEPFSAEAEQFTRQHIGLQVDLLFDSDCRGDGDPFDSCRDDFDRLLAYVRDASGEDFGAKLLRRGLARIWRLGGVRVPNFDRRDDYVAIENDARQRGVGIWSLEE